MVEQEAARQRSSVMKKPPDRGDILHIRSWETTKEEGQQGREIRAPRCVIVVTPFAFNRVFGIAVVCPITQGQQNLARENAFTVTLMGGGTKTQGVILCYSPTSIDYTARDAEFVEKADSAAVKEMLLKLSTLTD